MRFDEDEAPLFFSGVFWYVFMVALVPGRPTKIKEKEGLGVTGSIWKWSRGLGLAGTGIRTKPERKETAQRG